MKEPLLYKVIRPILYVWYTFKIKPIVINKEYIPKKGRCLLAGNHTNNLDCITLGYGTKRCIRFVAKDELTKGVKGYFFKIMGIVPVNRKIHDKTVIPTCVNLLNNESIVGIFPEGTINKTKDIIMPFKKGVVVMAMETNSPIIPFAINGKYKKGKLKIIFGKPYYITSKDVNREIEVLEYKVVELMKSIGDNL